MTGPAIIKPIECGGRLGERGLVMAKSLIDVPTEVVPVRVLNPNREKRDLRVGTLAATVAPVKVEAPPTPSNGRTGAGVLPNHLSELFRRCKENLDPSEHVKLRECLIEFQNVFSGGR